MAAHAHSIAELHALATLPVGQTADWVAAGDTAVWVGASGPNSVVRIDPATNSVTDTVLLPGVACGGLAIGFGYLWVPLCGAPPSLARIDLGSRRLDNVFPVGPSVSEGGPSVSAGSVWLITDAAGTLARIDPVSGAISQTIMITAGAMNLVCVGNALYATCSNGGTLVTVDAETGTPGRSFATGPRPHFLTVGGGCVWTLNQGDGSVSAIELASGRTRGPIRLGTPGQGGDIAFGAERVWTTMFDVPLSVVRAKTGEIERQWRGPGGDSLGIAGDALWLTDYRAGSITRYSIAAILGSMT